jgi:hypothetical protein
MRPTGADRERIAAALRARIGTSAGGLASGPAHLAVKPRGLSWSLASAVAIGIGVGGLFVAGALHTGGPKAPAPAQATPVPVATSVPATAAAPKAVTAVPAPAEGVRASDLPKAAVEEIPARARKRPSDRLAEEVEILSRAETELHAGRFSSALRMLEEHARKFPGGTLAPERRAARIHALCGLGRVSEADAELARLSPGSLHEGSAREACGTSRKD